VDEEKILACLLDAASAVFGHPVAADDDFFGLGGDSVTAVELVLQVEQRLGRNVDDDLIFVAEDFAGMARAMAADPAVPDPA
jgi:enterobactin synthetase component F